ncbi:MAG: hypothetical protein F4010_07380 [Cenarchaeum sp. SB0669_bin_11]|nr:hypothetical protein [Acidobacteriota bacterium]MYH22500.1 hypothetical protein [Acidobacteriota bacterium]MYL11944.1 hypothetical protein [Cenarchaeum sp. SB0669_bin_11]
MARILGTMAQRDFSPKQGPPAHKGSYVLPSHFLMESDELRLDAGRYSPELIEALRALRESGMRLERLADITAGVSIPPRFKRMYVEPEYGVPFLQGSHVVHFQPANLKYLSLSSDKLERWIVRSGWLLVTCSGTIGRISICPPEWDGWAASQHILRIVPDDSKCSGGYLAAFLASPFGQAQLTANTYGAVVDELTEEQVESILVPLPETAHDRALVRSVDAAMSASVDERSEAVALVRRAVDAVTTSPIRATHPTWFSLQSAHMGKELRIDAGHYNPVLFEALEQLQKMDAVPLRDVARVFMPTRFKRIYVEAKHGLPFLQGSHVVQFRATDVKYLSREYEHIEKTRIATGWILVTRSGTVGRVTMCPREWDGWSASEHIIRVVSDEEACPAGYLCSFLASPLGQIQLLANIHGAVVDELTEDHIERILVPLPKRRLRIIDSTMRRGMYMKSQAVSSVEAGVAEVTERFGPATGPTYKTDYESSAPEKVADAGPGYRHDSR